MAFPQLGYPQYLYGVGTAPSSVSPASPPAAAAARAPTCDVASLLAAAGAAAGSGGVYGAHPYSYSALLPYTSAELALFSHMGSQYELKDSPGISFTTHTSPAAFYPYGGFQYGDASRPKNATRESTSTLKAWLNEHRKNPYPTKGEKIMLAIITKMTLTQVSTWFANARRRLKKENKVTWGARAKEDGEDGLLFSSDNEDKREEEEEIDLESIDIDKIDENDGDRSNAEEEDEDEDEDEGKQGQKITKELDEANDDRNSTKSMTVMTSPGLQLPVNSKPKIWSLAETATAPDISKTGTAAQHPAFLTNHRLYTCPIGKIHNWNNGGFLSQNTLLNVRTLVGVNQHHHHSHHSHHHQQQQQQHQSLIEKDKIPEQLSPKPTDRQVESPTQPLKSSFRPLHDRNPQRILTT